MHALLEHELIATKFGTEFQKNGVGFEDLELQESSN
jgi:hypothetical protein